MCGERVWASEEIEELVRPELDALHKIVVSQLLHLKTSYRQPTTITIAPCHKMKGRGKGLSPILL
jgi:hypothetical protein